MFSIVKRAIVVILVLCCWAVDALPTRAAAQAQAKPSLEWPEVTRTARPWAYWWWMGSAVDDVNLTRQLELYQAAGMGGMHIVPIYGAWGYEDRYISYLSPKWMDRLAHTLSEAQRLGMGIDMTTGSGWCFGGPTVAVADAGAKAVYNVYKVSGGQKLDKTFNPQSTQALVARGDGGDVVDLIDLIATDGTLNWTAPSGSWDVHHVAQQFFGPKVKRAAPGGAGYMLNPFSRVAMTNYLKHFNSAFSHYTGPMPRAMYHDSFEYRSAWSPDLFDEFQRRRGYRLQTQLPALFATGSTDSDVVARVKSDYRRTVSEMLLDNYIGQWATWAGAKGMETRNQAHGSPGNLLDLYAAADIPDTEMFNKDRNPLVAKFASSAAHVMNKRLVAAETGTWLKDHFTTTLANMKYLVDDMFISGVNHIIYHGTAYSPQEAAWPGWLFYASTEMNPRNAIWRDVPALNAYIARAQSVLQSSRSDNNILLYWPISDLWHDADGLVKKLSVHETDWLLDHSIGRVAKKLWKRGYAFDYVSDSQLGRATADGISLPGGNYDVVVVPACDLMPEKTLQQLHDLAARGVTVIIQNKLPRDVPGYGNLAQRRARFKRLLNEIKPTPIPGKPLKEALIGQGRFLIGDVEAALGIAGVKRETLVDHDGVGFVRLARDDGYDYFIANRGSTPMYKWVPLARPARSVLLMDPMTGSTGTASTRRNKIQQTEVLLYLQPGESMIVRTFSDTDIDAPAWRYLRPAGNPVEITGTWQVDFIAGGPVMPSSFQTAKLGSWTTLGDDEAKRFAGTARYRITFDAPPGNPDQWVLDLGEVAQSARVKLNGHSLGTLITTPRRISLKNHLRAKGNILEIEVTNLSMNRIRDLDIRGVQWKYFNDINFVSITYQPFNASKWPVQDSGLLGPLRLCPMANDSTGTLTVPR